MVDEIEGSDQPAAVIYRYATTASPNPICVQALELFLGAYFAEVRVCLVWYVHVYAKRVCAVCVRVCLTLRVCSRVYGDARVPCGLV